MRISGRYVGIIGNLVFVVLISGCTSINDFIKSSGNGSFSEYNVSFNYPNGWFAFADNQTGSKSISVSKDSSFNGVQFNLQIMNNNGLSERGIINQMENSKTPGWNKISNGTLTIDGKKAYKDVFIYFVKNGKTYLILLQAIDKDFDKERLNFDIILNSLKIQ